MQIIIFVYVKQAEEILRISGIILDMGGKRTKTTGMVIDLLRKSLDKGLGGKKKPIYYKE